MTDEERILYTNRGYEPIDSDVVLGRTKKKEDMVKEKHIFLRKDQLLYDIDAETLIVTRARRDVNQQDNYETPTDEDNDLRPILHRWIEKRVNEVKYLLVKYLAEERRIATNNTLKMWEEIDIVLRMPSYFKDSAYPLLVTAVHDYVVNGVLYDYFSLNLTANDPVTQTKKQNMEDAADNIKKYANMDDGSVRKVLQPF